MAGGNRVEEVIGRGSELEVIGRFVEGMRDGPTALLIEGEAGIGKTSLWRAALRQAQQTHNARVLRAAPAESERGLTLGGLTDVLADVDGSELAALPVVQRHALEAGLLRAETSGQPPDQRTLSVATATLLRHLAGQRPLFIAIDDAQWLDDTSAAIVAYAIRRLGDAQVGVLLAVRGTPSEPTLTLFGGIAAERRAALHVGPMPLAGLHQLFLTRLGRSFPRLTLVQIEAASNGNPLYALEIGRALVSADGTLTPGSPLPIPATLGGLLEARLATLPGESRSALLFAALAAEPTMETLRRAMTSAPTALDSAVGAGIVRIDGRFIRFAHPLLAQAAIAAASAEELRRAHGALASTAGSQEARARHLAGATEGPDAQVAAALESAAGAARKRGATLDASALYERAADLTPPDDPDAALRRGMVAAECLFVDVSEVVQADALLERAIGAAPAGAARAEALSLRAIVRYYHGRVPESVRLGEEALAELAAGGRDDGAGAAGRIRRAKVLGRVAFLVMQLDLERGHELAAQGLRVLEPVPPDLDPDLLANLLLLHASSALGLVQGVDREAIERATSLISAAGRSWEHEGADGIAFGLARISDDLDHAIAMTHRLIEAKAGPGGDDPFNLVQLSGLQVLRGDMRGARLSAAAAAEGYDREGEDVFPAWRLRGEALIAAHEGRVDDARRLSGEGLELATRSGDLVLQLYHEHILGFVALSIGEGSAAHDHLTKASELASRTGTRHPGRFKLDGDRVEAALLTGDVEGARAIVEGLEHAADVASTPWTNAVGARSRALLSAASGDLDAAMGSLTEAMARHDALPMPFERARTLLVKGQVHRRRKEKRLADESLRAALSIFDGLGARLWVERTRQELGRIGLRPRAAADLSETERRVAELAAAGMSSRQIAEVAFLAPKTVGNVLGRVYEKLGIHSRAELGARLGGRASTGDRSG